MDQDHKLPMAMVMGSVKDGRCFVTLNFMKNKLKN
jgi:hypothetical protein